MKQHKVAILGAGLTGLAAASVLQDTAIIFEMTDRPGGLVKTENHNNYWFDHVLHLLHFQQMTPVEERIKAIVGDEDLHPIYPEAWVETDQGHCRYPLQMHLSGLNTETVISVLRDLALVTFSADKSPPKNFEEMLTKSFGHAFCKLFMLPYNRKVWKRPLDNLAPSGFQWNIDHPDFNQVLRGALSDHTDFKAYNSNGWYPRPPKSAALRGMEVLSRRLADHVQNLKLDHEVKEIDLDSKKITVLHKGKEQEYYYTDGCLSTIPLPVLVERTKDLPAELLMRKELLKSNRVISVMLSIQGPRPKNRGHWRYYPQEELSFTRLIYMHNFDPDSAPAEGWGLMTEITEPSEWPMKNNQDIIEKTIRDIKLCKALPSDCRIIATDLLVINPAYVVFTNESKKYVEELKSYYASKGLTLLGRYGQWEYSSMAQVIRDGFAWADKVMENSSSDIMVSKLIHP